jgi:DNA polymerase III epsilon subunit-like protein
MDKYIGFIYTETNGLHEKYENYKIPDVKTSGKNIFKFARLITLNYSIGTYNNGNYNEMVKERLLIKPYYLPFDEIAYKYHLLTKEKLEKKGINNMDVMEKFANDFKNVEIIISHNLDFHIKAIQVELYKSAVYFDFSKYILVDIINFNHNLNYPSLNILAEKYLDKDISKKKNKHKVDIIKNIFLKLYQNYCK